MGKWEFVVSRLRQYLSMVLGEDDHLSTGLLVVRRLSSSQFLFDHILFINFPVVVTTLMFDPTVLEDAVLRSYLDSLASFN